MIEIDGSPIYHEAKTNVLVATFNISAQDYSMHRLTPGLLAQKYEALTKYKAKDEDTKKLLAEALFNTVEKSLRNIASPSGRIQASEYVSEVKPLLDALAQPEGAAYIPARAPEALADIAVALADRVGKVTEKDVKSVGLETYHASHYRDHATTLGALVMGYAHTFSAMLNEKPKTSKLPTPNKLTT